MITQSTPSSLHNQCIFCLNRTKTKGTLLFMPKEFFAPLSPRIAVRWLIHHTSDSLPILHKYSKVGRNRAVMNNTLLLMPKRLFVPQYKSTLRYFPISTKLGRGVAHVKAVPRVVFTSPHSSARRDMDEKLSCPNE
jgi:hypothetical protein